MTREPYRPGPPFQFRAPWGGLLKGITALGTAILVGIPVMGLLIDPTEAEPWWTLTMVVMPLLILAITGFTTILGYTVTSEAIFVERPGRRTRIELRDVVKVEADERAMSGSLRTFGNGGLFSFSGRYRNQRLGGYVAYATDPARAVVVQTARRTLVLTPDDPQAFVSAVEHLRGR